MKYNFEIDISSNSAHSLILRNIHRGTHVLEFGPATGYMTKYMQLELGCKVSCVEIDPVAAESAKLYAEKMVIADLDNLSWIREFEHYYFDHIIFADVLEHLKDPWTVLKTAVNLLRSDGTVLTSIPNVGYIGLILDLIDGNFTYRPLGLLDDTHLRFFTRRSIEDLFARSGLKPIKVLYTIDNPEQSEFNKNSNSFPKPMIDLLSLMPDSYVYQFIHISKKANCPILLLTDDEKVSTFPKKTFVTQLFYDDGSGFNEKNSISIPLSERQGDHTISFSNLRQKSAKIRWDPAEKSIIIKIRSIFVTREDGISSSIPLEKNYSHNGFELEDEQDPAILFVGNDPQICFSGDSFIGANSLVISVQVLDIGDLNPELFVQKFRQMSQLPAVIAEKDQQICQLQTALDQKEQQIGHLQATVGQKEQQIFRLQSLAIEKEEQVGLLQATVHDHQHELSRIYSSLGWKLVISYCRATNKIFPSHTKRRKFYDYIIDSVRRRIQNR